MLVMTNGVYTIYVYIYAHKYNIFILVVYYLKLESKEYVILGKQNRPISVVTEFSTLLINVEDMCHCCGQTIIMVKTYSLSVCILEVWMCHSLGNICLINEPR